MPAKLLYKLLQKKVRDMDMNLVLWIWSTRTRTRTQTKVLVLVLTHFFSTRTHTRTHAKQSTRTRTQDLCTRPNPVTETQEVQGLLMNSLTIDRCIKTATTSCLYSVKLLWGGYQQSGGNIGNDLAPTGSVSNTVWNLLGEFQQSEADWTRCTKPQWKDLPDLVILFPLSAVYMRRWIWSALIRVMVSRLFGAKPLPEPVLTYNQLDPWEQTSVKL